MPLDIKVEISGDVAEKLKTASSRVTDAVDGALLDAAILLEGIIKKKISRAGGNYKGRKFKGKGGSVRTGDDYSVGGKGSTRSAPGEPPKSDTGRLVNSIRHTHGFLTATVGTEVNYAGYLEYGTSKMAARPYLAITLEENEDTIEKMIIDAMQKAMG